MLLLADDDILFLVGMLRLDALAVFEETAEMSSTSFTGFTEQPFCPVINY